MERSGSYLDRGPDGGAWLGSVDHKRISVLYLAGALVAGLFGLTAALALRAELLAPGRLVMDVDVFRRLAGVHGLAMVFLCMVPALGTALGGFLVPLLLGRENLAFPRLHRLSLHLYLLALVALVLSVLLGAVRGGWTLLPPLASGWPLAVLALGLHLLALSLVGGAMNLVATILGPRPAGLSLLQMPLLLWAFLITAILQLVAAPVLGGVALLQLFQGATSAGVLDPARGGDPVAYQQLFWFFAHAAMALVLLPGIGVTSEILSTFSRKPPFGPRLTVAALTALAALTLLSWGVHLSTRGQDPMASAVASGFGLLMLVPASWVVAGWLGTLHRGAIRPDTPLLFALGFVLLSVVGGLAGLFLLTLSTGVALQGTAFASAQLHLMLAGAGGAVLLAALHYWWPKMTGRMYDERVGRLSAGLFVLGANLAFLPALVLGSRGLLPGAYAYPPEWAGMQRLAAAGALLLAFGLLLTLGNLLRSLQHGRVAPADPWGARTLEWTTSSPPPARNFDAFPDEGAPYRFDLSPGGAAVTTGEGR